MIIKTTTNLPDLRRDYGRKAFGKAGARENPIEQFKLWMNQAIKADIYEPNACTLATCTKKALPSARIVLLKGYGSQGFCFYTNYLSRKGCELKENPRAAMVFFWPELHRQIRITGKVKKVSRSQSVEYFKSRPIGSQIGAIISPQSSVIKSEDFLSRKYFEALACFKHGSPVCPADWGGYRLVPNTIEFWQGKSNRLHDRLLYTLTTGSKWKIERLAP